MEAPPNERPYSQQCEHLDGATSEGLEFMNGNRDSPWTLLRPRI